MIKEEGDKIKNMSNLNEEELYDAALGVWIDSCVRNRDALAKEADEKIRKNIEVIVLDPKSEADYVSLDFRDDKITVSDCKKPVKKKTDLYPEQEGWRHVTFPYKLSELEILIAERSGITISEYVRYKILESDGYVKALEDQLKSWTTYPGCVASVDGLKEHMERVEKILADRSNENG